MPGRTYTASAGYRFGFNGKEMDNETYGTGNEYNYGARILDPRLGRWMSLDALAKKYPNNSPFSFALGSPIVAKDPDGNLVIFINGMHTGSGGSAAYWGGFDEKMKTALGDYHARYVDGAMGGLTNTLTKASAAGGVSPWALAGAAIGVFHFSNVNLQVRINAGHAQGFADAENIIKSLAPGETIKIVAHSMGPGFSRGYTSGIMDYAKAHGLEGKVKFEYELDVNAFQGASLEADPNVKRTDNKTGGNDGGKDLGELLEGNSVPEVSKLKGATKDGSGGVHDITDASDADKGHAIMFMSTTGVPKLGNGGVIGTDEQGSNNKNPPSE